MFGPHRITISCCLEKHFPCSTEFCQSTRIRERKYEVLFVAPLHVSLLDQPVIVRPHVRVAGMKHSRNEFKSSLANYGLSLPFAFQSFLTKRLNDVNDSHDCLGPKRLFLQVGGVWFVEPLLLSPSGEFFSGVNFKRVEDNKHGVDLISKKANGL